jgi:CMP-N-acetylneuraminic acid synthetase
VSILGIVPARGGSQGIPRKNLHLVGGRPLITWSIAAGLAASSVDRVIVTTDDDEIAAVARDAGAEVPFRRPSELAGPDVTDLPVFQHTLRWLAETEDYRPELVVHLRPTSPARAPDLIDRAVALLRSHGDATSLRSVSPSPVTPWKMWQIDGEGLLQPILGTLDEEAFNQPRQALPPTWIHDGVIDVIRPDTILEGSMTGPQILAFTTDAGIGVDIDTPDDLPRAEAALRLLSTPG